MKKSTGLKLLIVAAAFALSFLGIAVYANGAVFAYDGFHIEVKSNSTCDIESGSISGGGIHNLGTVNVHGGTFANNPQGDILNEGELNLNGGVFSGQIINNGVLNFSNATFNQGAEIVLNSVMTFKASPKSTVPMRLNSSLAEYNKAIAKIDGVKNFEIGKLNVTNLPENAVLERVDDEIIIKNEAFYTVKIVVENPDYGSVTSTSVKVQRGEKIRRFKTDNSIVIGNVAVDAKINVNYTKATVVDIEWVLPTSIASDGHIPYNGVIVDRDLTITVRFITEDNVKVTFVDDPVGYGVILPYREIYVPRGSRFELKDNVITIIVTKGVTLQGTERKSLFTAVKSAEYGDFFAWNPPEPYREPTFKEDDGTLWGFIAEDTTFRAQYAPKKHDITIISSEGGTTSKTKFTVPHRSKWNFVGSGLNRQLVFTYNNEEVAVVNPIPDLQHVFIGWGLNMGGETLQSHIVGSAMEFMANFGEGLNVTFGFMDDTLTQAGGSPSISGVLVPRGTVWSVVSHAQYGLCIDLTYNEDILASVHAIASPGFSFEGWMTRGMILSAGTGDKVTETTHFDALFRKVTASTVSLHMGGASTRQPNDLYFERKKSTKILYMRSIGK